MAGSEPPVPVQLKSPTRCVLWEQPELLEVSVKERFEVLETFADESHLSRALLECRECRQRYFYEFYEEVDWEDGDDAQYSTYLSVESEAEIEAAKAASHFGLMLFSPRLQRDYPKAPRTPSLGWIGKA